MRSLCPQLHNSALKQEASETREQTTAAQTTLEQWSASYYAKDAEVGSRMRGNSARTAWCKSRGWFVILAKKRYDPKFTWRLSICDVKTCCC